MIMRQQSYAYRKININNNHKQLKTLRNHQNTPGTKIKPKPFWDVSSTIVKKG